MNTARITQIIIRILYVALTGWLGMKADKVANLLDLWAPMIAVGVGALIDLIIHTRQYTKAKKWYDRIQAVTPSESDPPTDRNGFAADAPLAKIGGNVNVTPLIAVCMGALAVLSGCSNLTPRQVERIDTGIFIGADVGATAGLKSGKIPATMGPVITAKIKALGENLAKLRAWIAANPELADVKGMTPPEVTVTRELAATVAEYALKFQLLVPLDVANTQPANK